MVEQFPLLSSLAAAQIEASPFPIIITRVDDGVIVHVNKAGMDAIDSGYNETNPVGKTVYELGYHRSPERRHALIDSARSNQGNLRRNDIRVGNDTEARLTSTHVFNHEGTEYTVATLVDISEVISTESALADALERLQKAQAIAKTGDFVSVLNSNEFNGSAEAMRILGFAPVEATITTKELFSHFHPADRAFIAETMNENLPTGDFHVEHRLHPDINPHGWVSTHATVETQQDGAQVVRGTVQDISERKRQELEREQLQAKMQDTQKLESLGLLAGGIAHDFNNILAGIMGNADFALLAPNLPVEVETRLNDVVAASQRAADLTRQLLAYSGKGRFVIEPIDLSALIQEMADLLTVSVSREHALRLYLTDDLPATEVDATQIRQIVMNLIINAGEAISHSQGIISVGTGVQQIDEQYLQTSQLSSELIPGDYVYFEVSDNGEGMDESTLERIFDPFFTTKFAGRGLGLAAALGIAKGHQGAIKIYSEPGRGTTFKVFLPVSTSDPISLTDKTNPQADWQGAGTVLVIDDDPTVRDFLDGLLRGFGYEVILATDGQKGLDAFQANQHRIGLVLLDLTMPNMDGKDTFAAIGRIKPGTPTILMSGYNEQDATQEFVGKGLAGFIAKPFLITDVMAMVHAHLGKPTN